MKGPETDMSESSLNELMSPLDRISAVRAELTRKQQMVADYIAANIDSVTFSTLAGLSRDCGVSETCILRLTGRLGYSGFTEMQHAFRHFVRNRISMTQRLDMVPGLGRDSSSILQMIFQKGIEGLKRTMSGINPENFQKAVELLSSAKRVFMFGSRSSFSLANYFVLELHWIRDDVYALNAQSSAFDALASLTKDDVFLAISMPRYLRSTTKAMSYVYKAGVPTIAITDSLSSPLVPFTSIPLIVDNEIFSYCDNTVPILATITALLNAVGAATYPKSKEILARNEKTWEHFNLYLK